jgi:hypothetical protein
MATPQSDKVLSTCAVSLERRIAGCYKRDKSLFAGSPQLPEFFVDSGHGGE